MKVVNSLKAAKKRDKNCRIVRRKAGSQEPAPSRTARVSAFPGPATRPRGRWTGPARGV